MNLNRIMAFYFEHFGALNRLNEIQLDTKLVSLLSGGVIEVRGCCFLKKILPDNFDPHKAIEDAFDRTELECEINHIHVKDHLSRTRTTNPYVFEQAIRYTYSLYDLLKDVGEFRVIFACTVEPVFDCNVRFHKKRLGEEWLADDLEKYEEAILFLE